jgi:hypothetical protein
MNMIAELRETLRMEIRPNSEELNYLEAVIQRKDLELLMALLTKHLGTAAKEPGRGANLPAEIETLVDSMGGLRMGQSFFYRKEDDGTILFAALWPWESDPEKITLKTGIGLL